jgi:acyl CoA:acetate/3-ketoacid CoA transferase alpha subunit
MAMAAKTTIVEVEEDILPAGAIDADDVHTPGLAVHRLIRVPPPPMGLWTRKRDAAR